MLIILLIITAASMLVCFQIATSRQANRTYWVILGLLIGPLAIPFAFFAKPDERSDKQPEV